MISQFQQRKSKSQVCWNDTMHMGIVTQKQFTIWNHTFYILGGKSSNKWEHIQIPLSIYIQRKFVSFLNAMLLILLLKEKS